MIYVRFAPESRHRDRGGDRRTRNPFANLPHDLSPASTCCARPRERDWYSIRLAVHSGATSAGGAMTTPKAKLAGLALIAALYAGFTLGLTAPAWAGFDELR